MILQTSELVRYNANSRGTNTGDCTARAISLAFNIDYRKAKKLLNDSASTKWNWEFNTHENYVKVIRELGGGELFRTPSDEKVTVDAFVDDHPSGTYIIWCSKDGTVRRSNHVACVIDGKIYDSWDSRNYYILGYWIIENGVKGSNITNIGDYLLTWYRGRFPLGDFSWYIKVFDSIIDKNRKLRKLSSEYDIDINLTFSIDEISFVNTYTYKIEFRVQLDIPDWNITKKFSHKFAITFKPTMKKEDLDSYFDETFYGKLYSYIQNTIVYTVNDICEGQKLLTDSAKNKGVNLQDQQSVMVYDTAMKKSFNSLPYWVRRLATSFDIYRYNRRYGGGDEIVLYINTPPFDTEYEDHHERRFEANTMDILREELEYYKKTGDYEGACEIQYQY